MSERVNLGKTGPKMYQGLIELEGMVTAAVAESGFTEGFAHLLRVRASQINECAFCIRLHVRDAEKCGESSDRISVLPAWRETQYFSDKERAALELVEAITLIADGQLEDPIYQRAAVVLSSEEISAVEWLAIVINSWNRLAISSRYVVKP